MRELLGVIVIAVWKHSLIWVQADVGQQLQQRQRAKQIEEAIKRKEDLEMTEKIAYETKLQIQVRGILCSRIDEREMSVTC